MINEALEENDLRKCEQSMKQLNDSKRDFFWAVKQDLKNHRYLDNAKDKILEVKMVFKNIQNNFAQHLVKKYQQSYMQLGNILTKTFICKT